MINNLTGKNIKQHKSLLYCDILKTQSHYVKYKNMCLEGSDV